MNVLPSSCQRSRHINIPYFFIKDRVDNDEVTIVYCPTDDMVADIIVAIILLTTRVSKYDTDDWKKFENLLLYL